MIRHILGSGIAGRAFVNAARELFGTISVTGMPVGVTVQRTTATAYITNTALSVVLPADDTTPLVTEGTQTNTAAHALLSSSNKLVMRWQGFGSCDNAGGGTICAALFSSTATTAIAACAAEVGSANQIVALAMQHEHIPSATTSITYTVRFGPGSGGAGNARLNGTAAARRFGGVAEATLAIEEVVA